MICTLLRKPLTGTIIQTLTDFQGGGMNIDASRVGKSGGTQGVPSTQVRDKFVYGQGMGLKEFSADRSLSLGRFPTNLISACDLTHVLPQSNSPRANGNPNSPTLKKGLSTFLGEQTHDRVFIDYRDTGSATRFFKQVTL